MLHKLHKYTSYLCLFWGLFFFFHGHVPARGAQTHLIRIVGSSSVYPYISAVAEIFQKLRPNTRMIVESTGTGAGINLFARNRSAPPSAVMTSRPMTAQEQAECKKNGIPGLLKIELGLDGIVVACSKKSLLSKLTLKDLCVALSEVDSLGKPNQTKQWGDVNQKLPSQRIRVFAPPPSSGTRETFNAIVMTCRQSSGISNHRMREDGAFIEVGGHENIIVQKLMLEQQAMGIFSYSFLKDHLSSLRPLAINGVFPTIESIKTRAYPIVRKLYLYVRTDHAEEGEVKQFLKLLRSDPIMGAAGFLTKKGLISLTDPRNSR